MLQLDLMDFDYELPRERIAQYPAENRDESRLLFYNGTGGISHHIFKEIPNLIPSNSLLIANNTKVIPARFFMEKQTGGFAEVLLIEPISPSNDPILALNSTPPTTWKCIIGGKRIRQGTELHLKNNLYTLNASVAEKHYQFAIVEFIWEPNSLNFAVICQSFGHIPLPPYIKRLDESIDKTRYQTIFAQKEGSVAAPTAALHFTDEVLQKLIEKDCELVYITLHIGPGTFQPIETSNPFEHKMHSEKFQVTFETLQKIHKALSNKQKIFAVGTTTVRTIESLYWIALKLHQNKISNLENVFVSQYEPYNSEQAGLSHSEAIEILLEYSTKTNATQIAGETQLFILPHYKIKFFDGLITNFHLPRSTLLLLVSAFVGSDWRRIYTEALYSNYRFLSYGDSSLLYRKHNNGK